MRYAFIQALTEAADRDNRVVLVTGDLGFSVFESFKDKFPDRFINIGVAEQNMIGFATGLALTGKIVFCYSIATFATMRPFEQIRSVASAHDASVVVVGTGAGLSYGHLSYTHFSVEDIGLMRLIPNMTIYCPSDPLEAAWATHEAIARKKPAYLRLGMKGEPALYKRASFGVGKGTVLREGNNVAIIAIGNIVANALEASEHLDREGIHASVVALHTVNPIDTKLIKEISNRNSLIVTVEEHSMIGGLSDAVAHVLTETHAHTQLIRIGIPSQFLRTIGSQKYLRQKLGLDPQGIARTIRNQLKTS